MIYLYIILLIILLFIIMIIFDVFDCILFPVKGEYVLNVYIDNIKTNHNMKDLCIFFYIFTILVEIFYHIRYFNERNDNIIIVIFSFILIIIFAPIWFIGHVAQALYNTHNIYKK